MVSRIWSLGVGFLLLLSCKCWDDDGGSTKSEMVTQPGTMKPRLSRFHLTREGSGWPVVYW